MLNNLCAFSEVFSAKCSIGIFRSSAIKEAITGMWAGLLGFPLKGTGARKGESVSSSSLSRGIQRTTSLRSSAFLNVTIPLIPRYHPISSRVLAILSELVKLCATPRAGTGISFRMLIVSASASLLCRTTGRFSSTAIWSCLRKANC